jgi:hypothetical protein
MAQISLISPPSINMLARHIFTFFVACIMLSASIATHNDPKTSFSSKTYQGKMSTFGGPNDHGVSPSEGLAIYSSVSQRPELFLPQQPPGTTGLARRLNPEAHYIAMRWVYNQTPISWLRAHQVTVTNPKTGKSVLAWPADWGPNANTGRIADLSPGVAKTLGLNTDDICIVSVPI